MKGSRCMKERRRIQRLGSDTGETLSKGTGENAHLTGATLDRGSISMRHQTRVIGSLW